MEGGPPLSVPVPVPHAGSVALDPCALRWEADAVYSSSGGVLFLIFGMPVGAVRFLQGRAGSFNLEADSKEYHFHKAIALEHPMDEPPTIPAGIACALKRIKLEGTNIEAYHKQKLREWFQRVAVARPHQETLAGSLPVPLQEPGRRLQTVALGRRLKELSYRDAAVADALVGLSTAGVLGPWHIWDETDGSHQVEPAMDNPLSKTRAQLGKLVTSLLQASEADKRAIWEEACEEEVKGWLGPITPFQDLPQEAVPVRRFRIHPPGRKDRSCDDCSSGSGGNCFNEFCAPRDRIRLPTDASICATLFAICSLFGEGFSSQPLGSKDDLADAYKQFPSSLLFTLAILMAAPGTSQVFCRLCVHVAIRREICSLSVLAGNGCLCLHLASGSRNSRGRFI